MSEKRLERLESVKRRTGLSTSSIYELMTAGQFPKNFPLLKRAVAWNAADIDAWIEAKLAAREAA